MNAGLAPAGVAPRATGRGVRVALIDTGVNFKHPHLARPGLSVVVEREGGCLVEGPDREADRVGHGTAGAALLVHLAPGIELISVRVTDARPSTDAERLAHAIGYASRLEAELIAVPLGTPSASPTLEASVADVLAMGRVIVAAQPGPGVHPAAYPGVLGVGHRDGVDVCWESGLWWAEGRARPAPGGPPGNFYGPSLAVARLTAALARYREASGASGLDLALGFQKALSVL